MTSAATGRDDTGSHQKCYRSAGLCEHAPQSSICVLEGEGDDLGQRKNAGSLQGERLR